ncbi:MAG: DNA-formamidopyrimidine glycosylase family protein [Desulfobulbaceae bacterium]|nr:DNA-formamidopyrimidine glycosylase family protein [Desulfobulbaceae bacterium]
MPELPDVQIFKEYLDTSFLDRKIVGAGKADTQLLQGISPEELNRFLTGKSFISTRRYGKYLFARVAEDEFLVLHFGMTGFLRSLRKGEKIGSHVGLLLQFEDGSHLVYESRRKLGRISVTDTVERFVSGRGLGPDALELCVDGAAFAERLRGHRGSIKALLMNQKALAGIGNVYSDEILFLMGVHPKKGADELNNKERRTLAAKTCHVLKTAIGKHAGADGWPQKWLLPRRKAGSACPHCSGKISRITVSGRGTYFCSGHQS